MEARIRKIAGGLLALALKGSPSLDKENILSGWLEECSEPVAAGHLNTIARSISNMKRFEMYSLNVLLPIFAFFTKGIFLPATGQFVPASNRVLNGLGEFLPRRGKRHRSPLSLP
jgi:hypothetical protein